MHNTKPQPNTFRDYYLAFRFSPVSQLLWYAFVVITILATALIFE